MIREVLTLLLLRQKPILTPAIASTSRISQPVIPHHGTGHLTVQVPQPAQIRIQPTFVMITQVYMMLHLKSAMVQIPTLTPVWVALPLAIRILSLKHTLLPARQPYLQAAL